MHGFSRYGSHQAGLTAANANANINSFLRSARKHLNMEVGFVGEFTGGRRVFRHIDTDVDYGIPVGHGDPLEETYCQRVVDGRLPELIINPQDYRAAAELPVTDAFGIGTYISVPIWLHDGRLYGTFCCFSHAKHPHLNQDDLKTVKMFASMVGEELETVLRNRALQFEKAERIQRILSKGQLKLLYQPVYQLWRNEISGFECLARFPEAPARRADVWFAEAAEVGLRNALELTAIREGLAGMKRLNGGLDVHVNASPGLVMSGALEGALEEANLARLVLEVTEHEPVADYQAFAAMLAPLRARGLRLAVDDAGAGHATLRHILQLRPEIIKLDISLIRDIDQDKYKSALAAALIRFALETEAQIIAEGIETLAEFNHLRALGAPAGQGNYLGHPVALEQAMAMVNEAAARRMAVY